MFCPPRVQCVCCGGRWWSRSPPSPLRPPPPRHYLLFVKDWSITKWNHACPPLQPPRSEMSTTYAHGSRKLDYPPNLDPIWKTLTWELSYPASPMPIYKMGPTLPLSTLSYALRQLVCHFGAHQTTISVLSETEAELSAVARRLRQMVPQRSPFCWVTCSCYSVTVVHICGICCTLLPHTRGALGLCVFAAESVLFIFTNRNEVPDELQVLKEYRHWCRSLLPDVRTARIAFDIGLGKSIIRTLFFKSRASRWFVDARGELCLWCHSCGWITSNPATSGDTCVGGSPVVPWM
jgi:hypothetical protein